MTAQRQCSSWPSDGSADGARIPSALPRSRIARDRVSQRSVEPHGACPLPSHRPRQKKRTSPSRPTSAIAMAFRQLRNIDADKGFSIVRHGSSSCDEDRLGQSEQPSDTQCRASHLASGRTYGLTQQWHSSTSNSATLGKGQAARSCRCTSALCRDETVTPATPARTTGANGRQSSQNENGMRNVGSLLRRPRKT